MTLIVHPKDFGSKAKLKANLDAGMILLEDPSIVAPWQKHAADVAVGFSGVVTNHPLRNKFAKIEKRADGWKVS